MTGLLLANMAWASAAMLLVLALRRPVAHLFGAAPAYALWLLPLFRLILPPLPPLWPEAALLPPLAVIVPLDGAAASLPPDGGPGQGVPLLLAIWALGAAAFMIWQWRGYRAFLTGLSLDSRSIGAHRGLPLIESGAVRGPLALGLLDRRIVVPVRFDAIYSAEERALALDHEAIHHRRGDLWWNHAALIVLALNWFNPIAWFAFRAFRADQELACDAAVAAKAAGPARAAYAQALVKSASPTGLIAACPLNHAAILKRRLKMMKHHRSSPLRLAGGGTLVVALAGASLAFGSAGIAHPHPEGESKERRERIVIMRDGPGGEGEQRIRIGRGPNGIETSDCAEGDATRVEESSEDRRTNIVLCTRGDATPAERAERLQRARDRLANDSELSAEARQRVGAALDREIARLRGQ